MFSKSNMKLYWTLLLIVCAVVVLSIIRDYTLGSQAIMKHYKRNTSVKDIPDKSKMGMNKTTTEPNGENIYRVIARARESLYKKYGGITEWKQYQQYWNKVNMYYSYRMSI
jgi:hypothetical protein